MKLTAPGTHSSADGTAGEAVPRDVEILLSYNTFKTTLMARNPRSAAARAANRTVEHSILGAQRPLGPGNPPLRTATTNNVEHPFTEMEEPTAQPTNTTATSGTSNTNAARARAPAPTRGSRNPTESRTGSRSPGNRQSGTRGGNSFVLPGAGRFLEATSFFATMSTNTNQLALQTAILTAQQNGRTESAIRDEIVTIHRARRQARREGDQEETDLLSRQLAQAELELHRLQVLLNAQASAYDPNFQTMHNHSNNNDNDHNVQEP